MLQARGAAAAAIVTAAGFPLIGQLLRVTWTPETEEALMGVVVGIARTVVETYLDKSSLPSYASFLL